MSKPQNSPRFWRKLLHRLNQHRVFRLAKAWMLFLAFVAIFANFIANDVPIFCRYNGDIQFPVIQQALGNYQFNKTTDWNAPQFSSKLMPLIPYQANTIDPLNSHFKSPFGSQQIASWRYRHWLGTDQIGRDVLAGMVSGARVSVVISFLGIGIAAIIGILLGSLSGYFGDYRLRWPVWRIVLSIISALLVAWLAYILPLYFSENGQPAHRLTILFFLLLSYILLQIVMHRIPFGKKRITLPVDLLIMRGVEVFSAIPKLLLLLVISALFPPSIYTVAVVIGITFWPTITRFTRGEMLKIRAQEYLASAEMQNIPHWKILLRHAIPNAVGPAMIVIMLGLGNAILAESFLSFLGIGLPPDVVSWGKLLAAARTNISAWWLVLFPGLGIFFTIYSANRIGELLLEELKAG